MTNTTKLLRLFVSRVPAAERERLDAAAMSDRDLALYVLDAIDHERLEDITVRGQRTRDETEPYLVSLALEAGREKWKRPDAEPVVRRDHLKLSQIRLDLEAERRRRDADDDDDDDDEVDEDEVRYEASTPRYAQDRDPIASARAALLRKKRGESDSRDARQRSDAREAHPHSVMWKKPLPGQRADAMGTPPPAPRTVEWQARNEKLSRKIRSKAGR